MTPTEHVQDILTHIVELVRKHEGENGAAIVHEGLAFCATTLYNEGVKDGRADARHSQYVELLFPLRTLERN